MMFEARRWQKQREGTREAERGFTLIELLIVVVVLGVLAAVAVFALSSITGKSVVAACNSDARTVDIAVKAYDAQTGYNGSGTNPPAPTQALLVPTYLQTFPSSTQYTIGISATGGVLAQGLPYPATANACDSAGSTSTSTTASSTTTVAPTTTTVASGVTTTVAPTTTTVASGATTTVPASNGVIATTSLGNNYGSYYAQDIVTLTNSSSITSLTVTITMGAAGGDSSAGQFTGFPGGALNQVSATSPAAVTCTSTLNSGQTIPANYSSGTVGCNLSGSGSPPPAHPSSADTYSVVSTSNGISSTLTGHF